MPYLSFDHSERALLVGGRAGLHSRPRLAKAKRSTQACLYFTGEECSRGGWEPMVYMGVYVTVFLYAECVYVFAGGSPFYHAFVLMVSQGRGSLYALATFFIWCMLLSVM